MVGDGGLLGDSLGTGLLGTTLLGDSLGSSCFLCDSLGDFLGSVCSCYNEGIKIMEHHIIIALSLCLPLLNFYHARWCSQLLRFQIVA